MFPIKPIDSINVKGNLIWTDGRLRITIKREIRNRFQDLNNKEEIIRFVMEHYLNKDKLNERIDKLYQDGVSPVLLWFVK